MESLTETTVQEVAAILAASAALADHPMPQVRQLGRQVNAKTRALVDSVLPHLAEEIDNAAEARRA